MSPKPDAGAPVPDRPRSRDDVVFRELGDEWVLFDPDAHRLHVLNLTAALVWSRCSGEYAPEEIVRYVRNSFSEPPSEEEVDEDVRKALREFASEGLLQTGGA